RTDGPAIEYANGDKEWYLNGQCHRTDGPAIERAYGYKAWYLNGQCHRTDGPAVEYANGDKYWYLDGRLIGSTNKSGAKLFYINGIMSLKIEKEDVVDS
ncbi:MAG: hypothetical protein KGH64_06140, partial [Candidatus Micrarchaeota archaeon]|nr:hypothetical protein [Candidatus Micrarchaeota archaeon]